MNGARLGHLIRKYRIKQPDVIDQQEMKRILDAADLGLYWSIEGPMQIDACDRQARGLISERAGLVKERNELRQMYIEDVKKINAAGFDNLHALMAARPSIEQFARWLAKEFDGDAGLNETDWVLKAKTFLAEMSAK